MRVAHKNFTGGEVAPNLSARYDLQRYPLSAKEMTNFLPNLHGDALRRPGTYFLEDLGSDCWLIPFRFNAEVPHNYVLVFGNYTMRVANRNGWVLSTPIPTPYPITDCPEISYAQNGDIVYLAHHDYPLQRVVRSGDPGAYTWSISAVVLNDSLSAPAAPTASWHRGSGTSSNESAKLRYKVTAVDDDGRESLPSPEGSCTGRFPTDWVQGDYVQLTWSAVPDATEYNIYREAAGTYGLIGVVKAGAEFTTGPCTAIQVGDQTIPASNYVGTQSRTIRQGLPSGGGQDENGNWVYNTDSTGKVKVSEGTTSPAFIVGEDLIFCVKKTTTTETWSQRPRPPQEGVLTSVYWAKTSTSTSTSYYWAMTNPATTGQKNSVTTGHLGTKKEYPSGTIGTYTITPVFGDAGEFAFKDQNYEPDTTSTPKEDWDPFADGNYPGTIAFHQQRMVLGGTNEAPNTFYMSRVGDFENFRKSRPQMDDDPLEFQIASGSIDGIMWIASFGALLIGTASAEYKVLGESENGAVTPKECHITAQSYWGSSRMAPLIIGNSIMHCQRHGSRVRDLHYSLEKDGYTGNDLSVMAPHLVEQHTLRQWAFQQTPTSSLWCARDDGALLCLTYMKEQEIWGWSRHETQGEVRSLASLSGGSTDEILMVVKRRVGNTDKYYLERMEQPFGRQTDIKDAFFVDCGLKGEFQTATTTVSGLGHLEGCTVDALCDGSPEVGHVVQNGSITLQFPAKKVIVGLPYTSVLAPMPVEADMQSGSTLGMRRGYGQTTVRMFRSVGGKFGCDMDHLFDFPFTPAEWGEPCVPFSGDIECTPGGGQDSDTTIYVVQDRPLPMQIVAITETVDFGQQG